MHPPLPSSNNSSTARMTAVLRQTYELLFVVFVFCFFFLIAYIIYESVILVDTRRAGHPAECRDLKSVQRRMGITFTVGAKDVY